MSKIIISKLDCQRLKERVRLAKTDPAISSKQLINLSRKMEDATLLDPAEIPPDVVTMNSQVNLEYLGVQKAMDIRIVYPEQANTGRHWISVFAPLATSILGGKTGDIISILMPSRTLEVRIGRILFQPEAAGDYSL